MAHQLIAPYSYDFVDALLYIVPGARQRNQNQKWQLVQRGRPKTSPIWRLASVSGSNILVEQYFWFYLGGRFGKWAPTRTIWIKRLRAQRTGHFRFHTSGMGTRPKPTSRGNKGHARVRIRIMCFIFQIVSRLFLRSTQLFGMDFKLCGVLEITKEDLIVVFKNIVMLLLSFPYPPLPQKNSKRLFLN